MSLPRLCLPRLTGFIDRDRNTITFAQPYAQGKYLVLPSRTCINLREDFEPGTYRLCSHATPHPIRPPSHEGEFCFRHYLAQQGWFRHGYCAAYYPKWLEHGHYLAWATGLVGLNEVAPDWLMPWGTT